MENKIMYYRIDDSENPGWAQVEILGEAGHDAVGGKSFKVRVLSVVKPSTFIRLKAGTVKRKVSEYFLKPEMK